MASVRAWEGQHVVLTRNERGGAYMHRVVVARAAERRQAAEQRLLGAWWEGKVVCRQLGHDGEARVKVVDVHVRGGQAGAGDGGVE